MNFEIYYGCPCYACTEYMSVVELEWQAGQWRERGNTDRVQQLRSTIDRRVGDQEAAARMQQAVAEAAAQERRRMNQVVQCVECDHRHRRRNMRQVNDGWACTHCVQECYSCSRVEVNSQVFTEHMLSRATRAFCRRCAPACPGCDERFPANEMVYDNGDYYCTDCSNYCDDCGRSFRGDDCPSCDNTVVGLDSYHRTEAIHWLGGPVRDVEPGKQKGYYLGFELEVSATRGHVRHLHEWAQDNLGFQDAIDCKHDGSVEGFEIATQPMTPEFFESVDWDSFFETLEAHFPLRGQEPTSHGLHVHIGRVAFEGDDIAMAAFCYLISQDDHLERIGRREPTTYCRKVTKPVSAAIKNANQRDPYKYRRQAMKERVRSTYLERDAINLTNRSTIEIRAFRSTRNPQELKDAVRLVYVAAEYVRSLRFSNMPVSKRSLHWDTFAEWVRENHPEGYESIANKALALA